MGWVEIDKLTWLSSTDSDCESLMTKGLLVRVGK